MANPRDAIPPPGVPVNSETGRPLTEHQLKHLAAIRAAGAALYEVMHMAEGTSPPAEHEVEHHWQRRRMTVAATHLETALMFARKAALE